MITITYKPTPKQAAFHASKADEILYGGAAGGGKTKALVMDALFRTLKWPNTTACIFRRTFRELEDTDIKEALSSYPKELAKYNTSRHEFTLVNGSKILFRHCERAADRFTYSGLEVQFMYFDELTSFEQIVYDFLKTRKRAKKSLGVSPIIRSASNPGNIGHGWVKKTFVDAGPYMQIMTQEIFSETLHKAKKIRTQYIPALATENPFITEDYIFELEQKPEALRNALLQGSWDSFEGQVFTEFTNNQAHYLDRKGTHVIEPFEIPAHWPHYMSFDHGFTKPFSCGWWAVDPDGRAYRYREWYGCKKGQANIGLELSPREIAEGIIKREQYEIENNIRVDRIADPAIFDRSRGDSVADQMRPTQEGRPGVYFRKGDNTRIAGKMQLHQRLRFDEQNRPGLYVFSNCKDWIRTVPNLPYSETKVEDIDTNAEDHCLVGDTLVLTSNGWEKISQMHCSGKVVGHDGLLHRYTNCRKTLESTKVFTIMLDNGDSVTATKNHRFMLKDGTWKRLDELHENDAMFLMDGIGNTAHISAIEYSGKADVFNMEVEDVHSFIVNGGIVSHNCYDETRYFLMARPIKPKEIEPDAEYEYDPFRRHE